MKNRAMLNKLEKSELTQFQKDVLTYTLLIPKGKTRTYKDVASAIGRPRAYRAVGSALKRNPFPIIIPCHRVIRSDGELGEYSYGGSRKKMQLLKSEGFKIG